MSLPCETLLLGVTGSVGAVGLHNYVAKLNQVFAQDIFILMTRSAQKFVSPYTLQLYSKNPVFIDDFEIKDKIHVPHIELTQKADLFLIMPATATLGIVRSRISMRVSEFVRPTEAKGGRSGIAVASFYFSIGEQDTTLKFTPPSVSFPDVSGRPAGAAAMH